MQVFLKLFAFIYSGHTAKIEKRIGYRVEFTHIPEAWINGWVTFDMEKSLAKHGIRAWCIDYFTMGSLTKNSVSSRYARNEKQYQSWLGAYLVKFKEDRKFTIQDHFNLAVADQKNWLHDFGDPNPYCEISAQNFTESGTIKIGEYRGTLYEDLGTPAHSDVGSKSNNKRNTILMEIMALIFNKCNRLLNLKGSNFLPSDISTEYETVVLKGYMPIINLEKNASVVLYGDGAALFERDGSELKDYAPLLKEDILKAFRAVKIVKL